MNEDNNKIVNEDNNDNDNDDDYYYDRDNDDDYDSGNDDEITVKKWIIILKRLMKQNHLKTKEIY